MPVNSSAPTYGAVPAVMVNVIPEQAVASTPVPVPIVKMPGSRSEHGGVSPGFRHEGSSTIRSTESASSPALESFEKERVPVPEDPTAIGSVANSTCGFMKKVACALHSNAIPRRGARSASAITRAAP